MSVAEESIWTVHPLLSVAGGTVACTLAALVIFVASRVARVEVQAVLAIGALVVVVYLATGRWAWVAGVVAFTLALAATLCARGGPASTRARPHSDRRSRTRDE